MHNLQKKANVPPKIGQKDNNEKTPEKQDRKENKRTMAT